MYALKKPSYGIVALALRALSDKIGTDCTRHPFGATRRNSERASIHERAPLAERGRASLFVDFADDEMTFLVEWLWTRA
jgi:hypothetical protein